MSKVEEKTVLVLTDDMTETLPAEVQESIVWLSKELRPAELVPFNPVVVALVELQKLADIKYDPENIKESSQEYKDAKKAIGSFNSAVRAAKKEMKGAYDAIGKKILSMEKGFLAEASAVMDTLSEEFKPWLDAEEAKKAAAAKKKQDKLDEEMNALKKQNEEQAIVANRQEVYNKIRYEIILEFAANAITQLNKLNLSSVISMYESYKGVTYDKTVPLSEGVRDNYHLLSEDQIKTLKNEFDDQVTKVLEAYGNRLVELKDIESNRLASEREKGQLEAPSIVPQEQPEQPPVHEKPLVELTPDLKIRELVDEMNSVRNHSLIVQAEVESDPLYETLAGQIAGMMDRAIEYVNSKL